MLSESELDSQIQRAVAALPQEADGSCAPFWSEIRQSDLPYLPILYRGDLALAHRQCVHVLRQIGRQNIGVAYALENHLFVIGGVESYLRLQPDPALRAWMDDVRARRLLVANSHGYVHADRAFTEGIVLAVEKDRLTLNGEGSFMSLAGEADMLLLSLDGRDPAALLIPVKGNNAVRLGAPYFPTLLKDSDTRSLRFEQVVLPLDARLALSRDDLGAHGLLPVTFLCWHLSLSTAQFLGGASWLLDQAIAFAQSFKSFDNRALARLDGVVAEVGQASMRLACVEAMLSEVASALEEAAVRSESSLVIGNALHRARVANYLGMELNEEVARRSRRLLGTRVYNGSQPAIERVFMEILAGPLVPRSNAILERDAGHALLSVVK